MRIGIIAEGHADVAVVKGVIGALKKNSKYIDTSHNNLNYMNLCIELSNGLKTARKGNESLNLFCLEVEALV